MNTNEPVRCVGNQLQVYHPILGDWVPMDPIQELNFIMINGGMSVSDAIRRYTNIHGLPKGF